MAEYTITGDPKHVETDKSARGALMRYRAMVRLHGSATIIDDAGFKLEEEDLAVLAQREEDNA